MGRPGALRMVELKPNGLYCPRGDFYIDPWRPVRRAVITHAHRRQVCPGCDSYLCSEPSRDLLKIRLGAGALIQGVPFGEGLEIGSARVSLHPAGHILGSAQVRLEAGGNVWVVSGDYKREPDPSCEPFELVPCDTFMTESTFGLPIYRWPEATEVVREIVAWWEEGRARGRASVLFAHALGKTQRLLAELAHRTEIPVLLDAAAIQMTEIYRARGVAMLNYEPLPRAPKARRQSFYSGKLILAPPSSFGPSWLRRCGEGVRTALVSGSVLSGIEGVEGEHQPALAVNPLLRRLLRARFSPRRSYDTGFALSDHVDWAGLVRTIEETRASEVLVTRGPGEALARFLRRNGIRAGALCGDAVRGH